MNGALGAIRDGSGLRRYETYQPSSFDADRASSVESVVGEICCIGEQFDGKLQLLGIYDVRALGEVVGDAGQNVDVLVRDLDFE